MRTYTWLALIVLVALNVYAIYSMFKFKEQLTLTGVEANEGIIDYLLYNLESKPIQTISVGTQCPGGTTEMPLGYWPGILEGCYCSNKQGAGRFKPSKCLQKEIDVDKCKEVPAVPPEKYGDWKGKKLCVTDAEALTRPVLSESCGEGITVCCPEGTKACSKDFCVPMDLQCPITGFKKVSQSGVNSSATPIPTPTPAPAPAPTPKPTPTPVSPANASKNGTTPPKARSIRADSSLESKIETPEHVVPEARADTEMIVLDDGTKLQVLRDNSARPLLKFYIQKATTNCFDPTIEPAGLVVYPLLNNTHLDDACEPWGFDSLYSTEVDEGNEAVILKENKIFPGSQFIPEYDSFVNRTPIYLTARGSISLNLNDICATFDIPSIGNFRRDFESFKAWLLALEIIHGVILFLLCVSLLVIHELKDMRQYQLLLAPKLKLLAFAGLGILLAFTAVRFFVVSGKITSIEESIANLHYFVEGKCIEDYRFTTILEAISFDPRYRSIDAVNKLVFWLSLGNVLLIVGFTYLQDYQDIHDVKHHELRDEDESDRARPQVQTSMMSSSRAPKAFASTRVRVQKEAERGDETVRPTLTESVNKGQMTSSVLNLKPPSQP